MKLPTLLPRRQPLSRTQVLSGAIGLLLLAPGKGKNAQGRIENLYYCYVLPPPYK